MSKCTELVQNARKFAWLEVPEGGRGTVFELSEVVAHRIDGQPHALSDLPIDGAVRRPVDRRAGACCSVIHEHQ